MNRSTQPCALDGTRVVVTRSREQAGDLISKLASLGADVLAIPTIEIRDPLSWQDVDVALKELENGDYAWVVFTSVNAVRKILERAGDASAFTTTKVAAVGRSTAMSLSDRGIDADVVPDSFEGQALARSLGPRAGRVLLPRVAEGPRDLIESLTSLGWEVVQVDAYRNVPVRPDSQNLRPLRSGDFDVVTFTSPSTVRNFVRAVSPKAIGIDQDSDGTRSVACIGPSTAAAARESGVRVDIVAAEHTVEGLVDAVCGLKEGVRGNQ